MTETATTNPQPQNPFADMLTKMAAEQFAQMQDQQTIFQDRMAEQNVQVNESANRVLDRMARRRNPGPQYSEDVKKIANILTQHPQMVPVVNAVIVKIMASMQAAFQTEAAKYTEGAQQAQQTMAGGVA